MSPNNDKHAWYVVACALLVLGLGLIAFATVGGASDEESTARERVDAPPERAAREFPKEWQWDEPVNL
jgi:hypothetical protein